MAKKRVFLDECCGEDDLKDCFPAKAHVYRAKDFGVSGKEYPTVIDHAIKRGCLIITVNKDFIDYTGTTPPARGRMAHFSMA
jgi:hypothetical protein